VVVLAGIVPLQLSLSPAACAQAQLKPRDFTREFKEGIQLQDASDWRASREKLEAALRQAPADNGRPVRIYGTRYQSYLPHFYLGLALYHLRDCQGALEEWDRSLKGGVVQRTSEFDTLKLYQIDCLAHRPPQAQQ
jgi:hypothetical protein